MSTLTVEQIGEDLVIRLTPEARTALGLRPGDAVLVTRSLDGQVYLGPADMEQRLRHDRGRAFLRRLNQLN